MKVIKVLNNSLVLSTDHDNNEVIVMGKGIGFGSKVGDVLDPASIEKIYAVQDNQKGREYLRLIEDTPEAHIEIVQMILSLANAGLKGRINEQIFSRWSITSVLPLSVITRASRSRTGCCSR